MSLYADPNAPIYISITAIGTVGNLISFGVFSRKRFKKNNVRNMLRVSLFAETLFLLLNIIFSFFLSNFIVFVGIFFFFLRLREFMDLFLLFVNHLRKKNNRTFQFF